MTEKMEVRVSICPWCAEPVMPWEMTWIYQEKFYCSEKCCRKAAER